MARSQPWKPSPDRAVLAEFEEWLEQKIAQVDPTKYTGTSNMTQTKLYHEHQAFTKCSLILESIRRAKHQPKESTK